MKFSHATLISFFLSFISLLAILACEELGDQNNPTPPVPQNQVLDPDELSTFLVLKDASQINGSMPLAPDGQIKLDVRDSVYSIKGYPIGNRIDVLHTASQEVSGYFVGIKGASSYFDVPEENQEGQAASDTSSVLMFDLDPQNQPYAYPLIVDIIIQPHNDAGEALDEFERILVVEDPEAPQGCNSIAEANANNRIHWEWDYMIREYNGEVLNVFAPGLTSAINSQGAGCCSNSGQSSNTSNNPACVPNTTAQNLTWVELPVNDYSVRPYELMEIYEDGSVCFYGYYAKKQYNRASTDFCERRVGYTYEEEQYGGCGTHDFQAGDQNINFDFPNWVGGYRIRGGELIYTCHSFLLIWGVDDKFTKVFKRAPIYENPPPLDDAIVYYYEWKAWYD